MPKVICTLAHASDEISGVKFSPGPDGMVSEEIDAVTAARFASIAGYEMFAGSPSEVEGTGEQDDVPVPIDPPATQESTDDPDAADGKSESNQDSQSGQTDSDALPNPTGDAAAAKPARRGRKPKE